MYGYALLWNSQLTLVVKNPSASADEVRDTGSILGSGRPLGGGRGNPVQYSCLQNPRDRGSWQATVHGVTKSRISLKPLSTRTHTHTGYCSGSSRSLGEDRELGKAGRGWLDLEGWFPGCVILGIPVFISLSQSITWLWPHAICCSYKNGMTS